MMLSPFLSRWADRIDMAGAQRYFFLFALFLYALFGSPTPDSFGGVEIALLVLFILSIRIDFSGESCAGRVPLLALLFGISVPVLTGLLRGQAEGDILRDLVSLGFLFLPCLYGWLYAKSPKDLFFLMGVIGIAFSLRTIFSYSSVLLDPHSWGTGPPADLLYLANSPEVLFCALSCLGVGAFKLLARPSTDWMAGVIFLLLSLLPVVAMALMMQRAGIGGFGIVALLWGGVAVYVFPRKSIFLMVVLVAGGWVLAPVWGPVLENLSQKTQMVGWNARVEEWRAVFHLLNSDMGLALFGEGWGGRLEDPAVGGLRVNYTHSLISALLLKTGCVGAVFILSGVMAPVVSGIFRARQAGPFGVILFPALLAPFLIAVFLYASYKSLGFGLILLAFSVFPVGKLEKAPIDVS